MAVEVSHLVFNGCSFTYCQGLDNPKADSWPALLGKTLGLPVVNLAIGGSGNDSIQRRTYEYHYKNKKKYPNSKPFYIFGFSGATRREEFFRKYNNKELTDFITLDLKASAIDLITTLNDQENIHKLIEYSHLMNLDHKVSERKKLLYWVSVLNLCKAENTPYITTDYMPTYDKEVIQYVKTNFFEMYDYIFSDKNLLPGVVDLTRHIKKLPCNHEPEESMPIIHDAFYKKILEVYGEIKATEAEFLTLDDFYSGKTVSYNLHWFNNDFN